VRISFIPREEKFFDLIEGSARNMVEAAQGLKDLIENWQDIGGKLADITELEHEGDRITHQIIALLHRTFVTPFDREDIVLLANTMDDVTDLIHEAADVMVIYKVARPTGRAKELAGILLLAADEVARAVPHLRRKNELKKVPEHCIELHRLENLSDTAYRAALGELFEDSQDMGHIIKWREVYEHLESATDKCEDVANVLEGVALKHA
jgi:predicted phosphate transport protein (TIGR00153 family)